MGLCPYPYTPTVDLPLPLATSLRWVRPSSSLLRLSPSAPSSSQQASEMAMASAMNVMIKEQDPADPPAPPPTDTY